MAAEAEQGFSAQDKRSRCTLTVANVVLQGSSSTPTATRLTFSSGVVSNLVCRELPTLNSRGSLRRVTVPLAGFQRWPFRYSLPAVRSAAGVRNAGRRTDGGTVVEGLRLR